VQIEHSRRTQAFFGSRTPSQLDKVGVNALQMESSGKSKTTRTCSQNRYTRDEHANIRLARSMGNLNSRKKGITGEVRRDRESGVEKRRELDRRS
jgi:hypothetical protein